MKESNRKLAYTEAHCKKSNEKLGASVPRCRSFRFPQPASVFSTGDQAMV